MFFITICIAVIPFTFYYLYPPFASLCTLPVGPNVALEIPLLFCYNNLDRGVKKLDRILPTGDLAIKKVLASEENKDILAGLIWDFFEVDAQNLNIISPYNIVAFREFVKGEDTAVMRQTIKDVAATFKTADFVSEAQVLSKMSDNTCYPASFEIRVGFRKPVIAVA